MSKAMELSDVFSSCCWFSISLSLLLRGSVVFVPRVRVGVAGAGAAGGGGGLLA